VDFVYFLSKAFWFLTKPGNLVLLALLLGTLFAWIRPRNSGRIWLTILSASLLFATFAPVGTWLARPLEHRFPPPASLPDKIDGILVLGGYSNSDIADQTGLLEINGSADRIMISAALARRHPKARLMIAGRSERHPTLSAWLADMGISGDRIVYTPCARNTMEEAALAYREVHPGSDEAWLLVTSASHMPRAVGVFRKVGWSIIPYAVDYQAGEIELFADWPDVAANLASIGVVLKEWVGLLAYYAMDRTDELFPAPET